MGAFPDEKGIYRLGDHKEDYNTPRNLDQQLRW